MDDSKRSDDSSPKQSDITPKAFEQRKPVFDPTGRVEQLNEDETLVADIRRHPIGLVFIYIQFIVAFGLIFVLAAYLLPSMLESIDLSSADARAATIVFLFFIALIGLLFLYIAHRIYTGNQLIVSDLNITQVLQTGLFDRKVSELTMANVEDVTAEQNGILSTLFNYGTIKVETAGEQNNFIFPYAPNPNAYAKAMQDARGAFLTGHRRE